MKKSHAFRNCAYCGKPFQLVKPSAKKRYCNQKCAFKVIGSKVRAAAETPQARAKRGDALRGRGEGRGYIKRGGVHEHRGVAEKKIGRKLLPGEIVHHDDDNKRNNDPKNIFVLKNQGEHARLHFKGKKKPPKTVCKFGHALTPENTELTSIGRRRCIKCRRFYDNEWKKRKRREKKNGR